MQKLVWLLVILLTVFTVNPVMSKDWFVSGEMIDGIGESIHSGDVPFNNTYMCNILHYQGSGSSWTNQRRLFRGGPHKVVIDGSDTIHMVYQNRNTGWLYYAYKEASDTNWTYEKIALTTHERNYNDICYSNLVLDSSGYVHVVYYQNFYFHDDDQAIVYATNKTGSWITDTIEEVGDYGGTSEYTIGLDIDNSDTLYTTYFQKEEWDGYGYTTNNRLRYATKTIAGSWSISTIESGTSVGIQSDVVVDPLGYTHIAYYYAPTNVLAYAGNSGGSFVIRKDVANGGNWPSIDLDSNNNSYIIHHNDYSDDLLLSITVGDASISGAAFDTTGDVGKGCSILLYPNTFGAEEIHIAYYDVTNKRVEYRKRDSADAWQTPVTINDMDISGSTITRFNTDIVRDSSGDYHVTASVMDNRSSPFTTPEMMYVQGITSGDIVTGDTVYFRANELYPAENIVVSTSGLTFDAYEDGNLPTLVGDSGTRAFSIQDTDTTTIRNLHIRCNDYACVTVVGDGTTTVNFDNCVFEAASSPSSSYPLVYAQDATININNCYFYRKYNESEGIDWNTDKFIETLRGQITIKNSEFLNPSTHAIYLNQPTVGSVIEHNYIHGRFKKTTLGGVSPTLPSDTGWHQAITIYGAGSSSDVVIRNNIIDMVNTEMSSDDSTRAIFLRNNANTSDIEVINNLIIGKGNIVGVYSDTSNVVIANNVFYRNRRSLYTYSTPTGIVFRNNCAYNPFLEQSISGAITSTNNITDNPLLRNARYANPYNDAGADVTLEYHEKYYQYRPRPTSPLKTAGYSGVTLATTDILGNDVNQSTPSIGPIEVTTNTRVNIDTNHRLSDLPGRYDEIPGSMWAKGFTGKVSPSLYGINIWPVQSTVNYTDPGTVPTTNSEHTTLMTNQEDHYEILVDDLGATCLRYPGGLLSNRLNLLHTIGEYPRVRSRQMGRSGPAFPGVWCPIAAGPSTSASFCTQEALYPTSTRAVVVGDSVMEQYESVYCKDVAGWLSVAMQEEVRSYALSGARISGGTVDTIPEQYADAKTEDNNFEILIADGGGNDIIDDCPCDELDDTPIPCSSVIGDLISDIEDFIDLVVDTDHKKLILIGPHELQNGVADEPRCGLPLSEWQPAADYLKDEIEAYCDTYENCHWIDMAPAFNGPTLRDDCSNGDGAYCWPEYYLISGIDGLHLSVLGTRAWAEEILKDDWFNMLTPGDFTDRLPWTVMDYTCGANCEDNAKYVLGLDDLGAFLEKFDMAGMLTVPFVTIDDITPFPCSQGYLSHTMGTGIFSLNYIWEYDNASTAAAHMIDYMCDEYSTNQDNYGYWRGEVSWNVYDTNGHRGPYVLNEDNYPYSLGAIKYIQLGNERCEEWDWVSTKGNGTDLSTFGMDDLIEDFGTKIKAADDGSVCDDNMISFYHCRNPVFLRTESPTTEAVNTRIEELEHLIPVEDYWDMDYTHPYQTAGGSDGYTQGFPMPYLGDVFHTYFMVPTTTDYTLELSGRPSQIGDEGWVTKYRVDVYVDDVYKGQIEFPYNIDPYTGSSGTLTSIALTRGMHKLTVVNATYFGLLGNDQPLSINYDFNVYRESDDMQLNYDLRGSPDIWEIFVNTHYLEDYTCSMWTSLPTPNDAGPTLKRIGYTEWSTGHGRTQVENNFQNRAAHFISTADTLRVFAKWQVEVSNIWGQEMINYGALYGGFMDNYHRVWGMETNWTSNDPYYQKYESKALGFKIVARNMKGTMVNSTVINSPIFYLDKGTVDVMLGNMPRTSYYNPYITSLATMEDDTHLNILLINKSSDSQTVAININDFTVDSYQIETASTESLDSGNEEHLCYTGYRNPANQNEYLSCTSYEVGAVISSSISSITLDPLSATVIKCTGS